MKSSTTLDSCPPAVQPEFAVIGRSNVGKSSLINMLTGQKALALVSKTPGPLKAPLPRTHINIYTHIHTHIELNC